MSAFYVIKKDMVMPGLFRMVIAFPAVVSMLVGLTAMALPTGADAATSCPWVDSSSPPDVKADKVVARMRLNEKISMVGLNASPKGYENFAPAIPRLCIPQLTLQDGRMGVAGGFPNFRGVTQLPASIALASSWDQSLAHEYGALQGNEAWHKGIEVVQSPMLTIARIPQAGRNFETHGEDPYLNAILVLNTGGPVTMPWINKVKGVIEACYPGQEDGNAIAAVLFGDTNPSGKRYGASTN